MATLKQKLAFFIAKRKYLNKKVPSQNFKGTISNSENVLIILPDNAEDILKALDIPAYFKQQSKNVNLFCSESLSPVAKGEHNFEVISYNEESITRFGLPDKSLVKKIFDLKFDVVLDLNRDENLLYSILANIPKSKIVAGFKKENSDFYYNLQIANNQNNAEISYRNFLNSIQMF